MSDLELREWLNTLRFHLHRGPIIASKRVLREATEAIDTRNACRELTRMMMPKQVQFVPLPDGARVILL